MARQAPQTVYCSRLSIDEMNIYIASSEKGAMRVEARLGKASDPADYFRRYHPSATLIRDEAGNDALAGAVEAALNGRHIPQDLSLDIVSTPFQMKVWKRVSEIPFGRTMTYGEVARAVGSPGGARAVGQAMATNPLPLIFP